MEIAFWIFGIISIVGALGVLLSKKPINGILWLLVNFLSLGGLYISVKATFLGIVQILVYAGAIIVLFLFFVMLTNVDKEREDLDLSLRGFLVTILSLSVLPPLLFVLKSLSSKTSMRILPGTAERISQLFLHRYLLPFEVISLILLVALMTSFLFSKRRAP